MTNPTVCVVIVVLGTKPSSPAFLQPLRRNVKDDVASIGVALDARTKMALTFGGYNDRVVRVRVA